MARRLAESGVRYTMLIHGVKIGGNGWDHHGDVKGRMVRQSAEVDTPVAALLTDLQQLLKGTLVVWASEMGRTLFPEVSEGRPVVTIINMDWSCSGRWQCESRCHYRRYDFSLRAVEERFTFVMYATTRWGLTMNSYAICMLVVIVASQTSVVKSYMI